MFRKKKGKSSNKKHDEIKFKKRSILLSNHIQSSYNSSSHDSSLIPRNIVDRIIPHLGFKDLINFSLMNKSTYNYIHHEQTDLWQSLLTLIGLFSAADFAKYHKKHKQLSANDFYKGNMKVLIRDPLTGNLSLDPLLVYPRLIDHEKVFRLVYNPKLFKLQFVLVYNSLFPLYNELVRSNLQLNTTEFIKKYNNPIQQSVLLNGFLKFSKYQLYSSDPAEFNLKQQNLQSVVEFFENACLREIEIAYDNKDFQNKVNYYTNVLINLNDNLINNNLVSFFLQKLNLNDLVFDDPESFFITNSDLYDINTEKLSLFFDDMCKLFNEQIETIDQIFVDDKISLILSIFEEIIQDYILEFVKALYNKSKTLSVVNESIIFTGTKFLSADCNPLISLVPLIYSKSIKLFQTEIKDSKNGGEFFRANLINLINSYLEEVISDYLDEEAQFFRKVSEFNLRLWDEDTKKEESKLEEEILKNVKISTENNKNNTFLKLDLVTGFKNILKPINVTFEGMIGGKKSSKHDEQNNADISDIQIGAATAVIEEDEKLMTEFEAQLAIMNSKLIRIKSFFSLDLTMNILNNARASIQRMWVFVSEINLLNEQNEKVLQLEYNQNISKNCKKHVESEFIEIMDLIGEHHVKKGFEKAIQRLKEYNPDELDPQSDLNVQPLVIFTELVNIGDLIQNLIEVFYNEELVNKKVVNKNQDFLSKVLSAKKSFELSLDDNVANGLNIGIDALVNKVQHIYDTEQNPRDFNPDPNDKQVRIGVVTPCAHKTVDLLQNHMKLLAGSTEKSTIDVFQQEISQRFFALIVKNLKKLKINTTGALTLISDLNYYYDFIVTLKQKQILPYFIGLKTVGQIYLIDGHDAKLIGKTISDLNRFNGIFQQEEIYELVQCREDWLKVKKEVEKEMFGMLECTIM